MGNASTPDGIVIGAGVIGGTVGLCLQEAGYRIQIRSKHLPEQTSSAAAAAFWYPYHCEPPDAGLRWGIASYQRFRSMAAVPGAGISFRQLTVLFSTPVEDPAWARQIPTFRRATPGELLRGYKDGYVLDAPVIEMPVYLAYLLRTFQRRGGCIAFGELHELDEALGQAAFVVNASGLGARELAGDDGMYAIRGQVVRLAASESIQDVWFDPSETSPLYVVRRGSDVIVGGTAEDHVNHLDPDASIRAAILDKCRSLDPRLEGLQVLGDLVGLRPARVNGVRLEVVAVSGGKRLVHCYGHGGGGVTLSWGCAEDVLRLIEQRPK